MLFPLGEHLDGLLCSVFWMKDAANTMTGLWNVVNSVVTVLIVA